MCTYIRILLLVPSMCLLVNLFVAFLCTLVLRMYVALAVFQLLCFLVLYMYPDLLVLQEAN